MTDLGGMQPTTFRGSRRQRRFTNLIGLGFLAIGIAALALPYHSGPDTRSRYGAAALFFVLAILSQAGRATRVTVDAVGLRTSSVLTKRSHAWSEIETIESKLSNDSGGDWSERVRVQPLGSRAFYLARPSNSARGGGNPEYDLAVATIMEYWRNARSSAQSPP